VADGRDHRIPALTQAWRTRSPKEQRMMSRQALVVEVDLLQSALLFASGMQSVIPCNRRDKQPVGYLLPKLTDPRTKRERHSWDPFKEAIADETTIRRWFADRNVDALAVICGAVSGNREVIDLDEPELFSPWHALVEELAPGLLGRLVIIQTQSGHYHIVYRCETIAGNQKLAMTWEIGNEGQLRKRTLIETRGEGGYALAPPTEGYSVLRGDLFVIPTVTPADRAILFEAAQTFNRVADDAREPSGNQRSQPSAAGDGGRRPGSDFNDRGDPLPILENAGWTPVHQVGDVTRLRRPGKDRGVSATWNHIPRRFFVFSTNAHPFEPDRTYSPFAVYTLLQHRGDYAAAARALAAEGYGAPQQDGSNGRHRPKQDETSYPPSPDDDKGQPDALVAMSAVDPPATEKSRRRRCPRTAEYIAALAALGYSFRLNECNDDLEVNGQPITDPLRAKIRSQMRDLGYWRVHVMEDAYLAEALKNSYHPVREYLNTLLWDGEPHIARLVTFFRDKHNVFPFWFKRWVIGAVAKVMAAEQNPILILDGLQGLGKSHFARWLASPLPDYFIEGPIEPSDKDSYIRLISYWIWEVAELGATTRRADREALKHFITARQVIVRKPYGRYDVRKPAMASMVGTINNELGFLTDPTGTRRFLVATLTAIDWDYATELDINQVWAEAVAAWRSGEPWQLDPDEAKLAAELNEEYRVEDPIENLLQEQFIIDASRSDWWTSSAEVLLILQDNGLQGNTRANQMAISATMTRLGIERRRFGGRWGYTGIAREVVANLST
jgi:hypothetical protein